MLCWLAGLVNQGFYMNYNRQNTKNQFKFAFLCPRCTNPLDVSGWCTDCLYYDDGITARIMDKYALEWVKTIPAYWKGCK